MGLSGSHRRAVIIANPTAGTTSMELIGAIERYCADRVGTVEVRLTGHRGHAEELASAPDLRNARLVVAVGGDGTASEVVTGLSRLGTAGPELVMVPTGTGNSLHREIWDELSWTDTLDIALDQRRSRVRWLDLAQFAGETGYVVLGAASGLVADALVTARELRDVPGRDRYRLAIARTLKWYKPYEGRVLVDGVEIHRGPTVLANVGGGRYRGGSFKLLPRSVVDDGLLDVCVVDGALDPRMLPTLAADGRHVDRPEVGYARGRSITVERIDGEPLSYEHDGEYAAGSTATAFTIRVLPHVVRILAPQPAGAAAGPCRTRRAEWAA